MDELQKSDQNSSGQTIIINQNATNKSVCALVGRCSLFKSYDLND